MNTFKFDPRSLAVGLAMGVGATLLVAAERPGPATGPTPPVAVPSIPAAAPPAHPRFQMEAYAVVWEDNFRKINKGVFLLDTRTGRAEHIELGEREATLVREAQP